MENIRLIKKPNLIYLSLIILISFIFSSCGPEKDDPKEHEYDTSTSNYVSGETYLPDEMYSL